MFHSNTCITFMRLALEAYELDTIVFVRSALYFTDVPVSAVSDVPAQRRGKHNTGAQKTGSETPC